MNKTRNGVMTGAIVFIAIALTAILLLNDSGLDLGTSFMRYVDVALEQDGGETKRYLAVAYSETTRAIDAFEPDDANVYVTSDGAYASVTDEDKHVTNTLIDPTLYDTEGNAVEGGARLTALLEKAQSIDGAIRRVKIFEIGSQLFAQVTVYIGAWETNALYHFIDDDTRLRHLGSFQGEEIAGLRLTPSSGAGE